MDKQPSTTPLRRVSWLSIGKRKHNAVINGEQSLSAGQLTAQKQPVQLTAATLQTQAQKDELFEARCALERDTQQLQAQKMHVEAESKQLQDAWTHLQAEKLKLQAEAQQLQLDREQATHSRHVLEQQTMSSHHLQHESSDRKHQLHPSTPPATAETVTAARGVVLSRSPSLSRTPSLSRSASIQKATGTSSISHSPRAVPQPLDPNLTPAEATAAAAAAQEAVHQAIHDAATAAAAAAAAAAAVQQYYNQQQLQECGLNSHSSSDFNGLPAAVLSTTGNVDEYVPMVPGATHGLGAQLQIKPGDISPGLDELGHRINAAVVALPSAPVVRLVGAGLSADNTGSISVDTISSAHQDLPHTSKPLTVKTCSGNSSDTLTATGAGDEENGVGQQLTVLHAKSDHAAGSLMDLHEYRCLLQHLEQQRADLAAERRQLDSQRSELAEWSHMLRSLQHTLDMRERQLQQQGAQQ